MRRLQTGFTLLELSLTAAIIAVLAMIAIPKYQDYREGMKVQKAITDIAEISAFIKQYDTEIRALPDSLSQVGADSRLDPWGNPYQYFNISTAKGKGMLRKDKSLNPINSDFDLYSMGKDGKTATALTATSSHDDVIRARDGQFIGLASDF